MTAPTEHEMRRGVTTPSGNNHVRPCVERASQEDPDEGRQFDEVITIARGLWSFRNKWCRALVRELVKEGSEGAVCMLVPYSICS